MMKRRILLIEPNYRNKYPPIGLMKIATYHKMLGDDVRFHKGDIKNLVVEEMAEECFENIVKIDPSSKNYITKNKIGLFIKYGNKSTFAKLDLDNSKYSLLLENKIRHYRNRYFRKDFPKFDRVYVTTLFTFYWSTTVKTIESCKFLVRKTDDIKIGGVLASLLHQELECEVKIKPFQGLLDKPGILDEGVDIIIDDLPLDYSILDEIDYVYPTDSAYFTFMTKGCTRKCAFCSVPKLEPTYLPKIPTIDKFEQIKENFGEQRNLLLMDNNVLASPYFPEIIKEIKDMGFYKGATYVEPNQYEIAIRNLKNGVNDRAYVRRAFNLIKAIQGRLRGEVKKSFIKIREEFRLLQLEFVSKENLIAAYDYISPVFEKYRNKQPKARYVDFNQGTDCRYVTDEYMKLMSEIPIKPLRIAFDYIGIKDKYIKAVELAAKYEIGELSNYILYNFTDKPEDLYERLRINIHLAAELNIEIFSFPMKYIPLFGEEAKHRDYVGKHWNSKFIRAIQAILNVTKGIVASGEDFFYKAFGANMEEYFEILYMPRDYIMYRSAFEEAKLTEKWQTTWYSLSPSQLAEAKKIIEENDFKNLSNRSTDPEINDLLSHYTIDYKELKSSDNQIKLLKKKYDQLIKDDNFVNLTLTYDFEPMEAK